VVAGVIAARDVLSSSPASARAASASRPVGPVGGLSDKAAVGVASPGKRSPLRTWLDEPVAPVERNIFTFARPGAAGGADSASTEAKSRAEVADSNQRREARAPVSVPPAVAEGSVAASGTPPVIRPKVQARQFRLQSTLMGGPQPAALIDGQMVREGDVVARGSGASRTSYRVLKIEARRVILEREGIRSEIPLE
jgi:hypothetical protein